MSKIRSLGNYPYLHGYKKVKTFITIFTTIWRKKYDFTTIRFLRFGEIYERLVKFLPPLLPLISNQTQVAAFRISIH